MLFGVSGLLSLLFIFVNPHNISFLCGVLGYAMCRYINLLSDVHVLGEMFNNNRDTQAHDIFHREARGK